MAISSKSKELAKVNLKEVDQEPILAKALSKTQTSDWIAKTHSIFKGIALTPEPTILSFLMDQKAKHWINFVYMT